MQSTFNAMNSSSPAHTGWSDERIDRLARGLMPVIFGRPAHTPTNRCDHRGKPTLQHPQANN
jgi:hypothetical protein